VLWALGVASLITFSDRGIDDNSSCHYVGGVIDCSPMPPAGPAPKSIMK